LNARTDLAGLGAALQGGVEAARTGCRWLLDRARQDRNVAGAAGVNWLMLLGYVCGGWLLGQSALMAAARLESGGSDESFLKAKIVTARFYCEHLLPRAGACLAAIQAGPDSLMALAPEQF
jgi:hypothetical protein